MKKWRTYVLNALGAFMIAWLLVCAYSSYRAERAAGLAYVRALQYTASPEDVAYAYYMAMSEHQYEMQRQMVSEQQRRRWPAHRTTHHLDFYRIDMATFKVEAMHVCTPKDLQHMGGAPYLDYYAVRDLTVSYVQLTATASDPAGGMCEHVWMVRETPTSPWRFEDHGW